MKSVFSFLAITLCLFFISANSSAQSPAGSSQKAVIAVVNLTCDGDMPTIKKQLLNQDGIESVDFTKRAGGSSTFTVLFNDGVINLSRIHKAIESTPGCDDKSTTPYRVKKDKKTKTARS
ncbi:MAG: heavy metal-associated domain-containing protein [Candidatus Pseudobacter hemicellulosilyticus]|uniref:Heavy metal-associated domain-containing protein n=1 Tax=Candidatus Pseudobacter hemicellulosilyticus TaxID=3121375 RepID=A0AAJ6BFT6_9BACT|nr:MAG: heavy metal-associated domain-containing protein [Pseudobacter sp.]